MHASHTHTLCSVCMRKCARCMSAYMHWYCKHAPALITPHLKDDWIHQFNLGIGREK